MASDMGRRTARASQPNCIAREKSQVAVLMRANPDEALTEMGLSCGHCLWRWPACLPRSMVCHVGSLVAPCPDGIMASRPSCTHVTGSSPCPGMFRQSWTTWRPPFGAGRGCSYQGHPFPPVGQAGPSPHTWNIQKTNGGLDMLHDSPSGFQVLGMSIKNNLREAGRGKCSLLELVNPLQINASDEPELLCVSRRIWGVVKLRVMQC